jgi:hypothetical protein
MRASVGDRIVLRGCQWGDSGHEAILYPGSDAIVDHFEHSPSR